ncbi:MAG: hypothetical protein SH817_03055 [Leptospira sp.]|nr:hypothetical protein [Leptospira sp.]
MQSENRLRLLAESSWLELAKVKSNCSSLKVIDLKNSNINQFFCFLNSFVKYSDFSNLLGVPYFVSGPHENDRLVTDHLYEFGHYHPEFPVRIRKFLIPALSNPNFKVLTQNNYDIYVQKLARTFFVVIRKLRSNESFYEREVERYHDLVSLKRLEPFYLEKYSMFMHPEYTDSEEIDVASRFKIFSGDELYDKKLVRQCVGFWVRRNLDKTDTLFYEGLIDLLTTYDLQFLKNRTE